MIRACRCAPRLAGRRRTTGSLRDSDEGPGAGGAVAPSRRAVQRPRYQVSRAAEDHILHCLSGLRANFAKFSFQKYPQRPAITRRSQPGRLAADVLAQAATVTTNRDSSLSLSVVGRWGISEDVQPARMSRRYMLGSVREDPTGAHLARANTGKQLV